MTHQDLLAGPPPTLLPEDDAARAALDAGATPAEVASAHPTYALSWALLAEDALAGGRTIEGYAFARTGYHRSLDLLRRNGWKGHGPVPWSHEPNRGFLRSLAALATAAGTIGESDEATRCADFLRDSSAEGAAALGF
jgi:hypothetical protein